MEHLARAATRLATNPLGIIALFLLVAYAIAGTIAGFAPTLPPRSQEILIWFIVTFPVLVLIVFSVLVVKYHTNLYAPGDFKDESLFATLSASSQRIRLESTIEEMGSPPSQPRLSREVAAERVEHVFAAQHVAEYAEAQEDSIPHVEPKPSVPFAQALAKRAFLAEELAIRKLEAEWESRISRQVIVEGHAVDGFVQVGGEFRVIEVILSYATMGGSKVTETAAALQRTVEDLRGRFRSVHLSARGYIVLVLGEPSQNPNEVKSRLAVELQKAKASEIVLCVFSLEVLGTEFGVPLN